MFLISPSEISVAFQDAAIDAARRNMTDAVAGPVTPSDACASLPAPGAPASTKWTPPAIQARKRKLSRIFWLLATVQIIINLDAGAVPAGLLHIGATFDMGTSELGLLAMLVYQGVALGCLTVGPATRYMSPLRFTQLTMALNIACTCFFGAAQSKGMLLAFRLLIGFLQAMPAVYFPVWVDEFAPADVVTFWMALINAGGPLGITIGYVFSGAMTSGELDPTSEAFVPCATSDVRCAWRVPFYLQSVALVLLFICMLLIPKSLFDLGQDKPPAEPKEPASAPVAAPGHSSRRESAGMPSPSPDRSPGNSPGLAPKTTPTTSVDQSEAPASLSVAEVDEERVNEYRGYAPAETTPKTTPKKNNLICELFGNGPYIFTVMGLSSLFFVFTGVQVWVTSYVVVVIGKSQAEITPAFGVTSITAPIIGVIAGGIFIDKIGGYKGEAAMALTLKICFAFACLAATFAITCAYVPKAVADQGVRCITNTSSPFYVAPDDARATAGFWWCIGLIFITLVFGCAIIPAATGCLVSAVPPDMRSVGSALSMFCFQQFGFAFSPLASALIGSLATFSREDIIDCLAQTCAGGVQTADCPSSAVIDVEMKNAQTRASLELCFQVVMLCGLLGVACFFAAWRFAVANTSRTSGEVQIAKPKVASV
jgi:MFS family permease